MSETLIASLVERVLKQTEDFRTYVEMKESELSALRMAQPAAPVGSLRFIGDTTKLIEALAAAGAEFETITKDAEGKITKDKYDGNGKLIPGQTFNYADLASLIAATKPALSKHGVTVMQFPILTADLSLLTTVVAGHGARIECDTIVPVPMSYDKDTKQETGIDIKAYAGNLTYMRRYGYQSSMCLGAAPNEDADQVPAREPQRTQAAPAVGGGARQNTPSQGAAAAQRHNPPVTASTARANPQQEQGRADAKRATDPAAHLPAGHGVTSHASTEKPKAPSEPPAATTPADPRQTSIPGTETPAQSAVPESTIEYATDAEIYPHLLKVRNALWNRLEFGMAAATQYAIDNIGKPIKKMDIQEANRFLRIMQAEDARRATLSEAERRLLFSGEG